MAASSSIYKGRGKATRTDIPWCAQPLAVSILTMRANEDVMYHIVARGSCLEPPGWRHGRRPRLHVQEDGAHSQGVLEETHTGSSPWEAFCGVPTVEGTTQLILSWQGEGPCVNCVLPGTRCRRSICAPQRARHKP